MSFNPITPTTDHYAAEAAEIARLYYAGGYVAMRAYEDRRTHWRNALKYTDARMSGDMAARFGLAAGASYAALLDLIEKDLRKHPPMREPLAGWSEGEHPETAASKRRVEAARKAGLL